MDVTQNTNDPQWRERHYPKTVTRLRVELHYNHIEMGAIQQGFLPWSMDDKWWIFYEAHVLVMARSWTGNVMYQLPFERLSAKDWVVRTLIVNRDLAMFRFDYYEDPDHHNISEAQFLIDILLLRDVTALDHVSGANPLALWHQYGKAMTSPEFYGVKPSDPPAKPAHPPD